MEIHRGFDGKMWEDTMEKENDTSRLQETMEYHGTNFEDTMEDTKNHGFFHLFSNHYP
jgi:hypothetical protein